MQRDDKKLHVKSDYILKELFKHISNSHATWWFYNVQIEDIYSFTNYQKNKK